MSATLYVALGGALGAVLRYLSYGAAIRLLGPGFPWGTLFVNLAGSLLMGLLMGWLTQRGTIQTLHPLLATGLLGGFTTFSAFSLDAVLLYERGNAGLAAAYVLASVMLAVLALICGLWLTRTPL